MLKKKLKEHKIFIKIRKLQSHKNLNKIWPKDLKKNTYLILNELQKQKIKI